MIRIKLRHWCWLVSCFNRGVDVCQTEVTYSCFCGILVGSVVSKEFLGSEAGNAMLRCEVAPWAPSLVCFVLLGQWGIMLVERLCSLR